MTKLLRSTLPALLVLSACADDPVIAKDQFPLEMAQAVCKWYFNCCDANERTTFTLAATTEAQCINELTLAYATLYRDADPAVWDGKAAVTCVDTMNVTSTTCPASIDPSAELAKCAMVVGTVLPGDSCTTQWQCTTRFCRAGTCANPIKAGMPCTATEPCAAGLRCVSGLCQGLQPDNASCVNSQECFSGFCGGGKCQPNTTGLYGCDGKNL